MINIATKTPKIIHAVLLSSGSMLLVPDSEPVFLLPLPSYERVSPFVVASPLCSPPPVELSVDVESPDVVVVVVVPPVTSPVDVEPEVSVVGVGVAFC